MTRKINLINYLILWISIVLALPCFAKTSLSDVKKIYNFDKAMNMVKSNVHIPVFFPTMFPKKFNQPYYANLELTPDNRNKYYLYVDSTIDCGGVHACNIGQVHAEKNGKLEVNYDRNHQNITKKIQLANKTIAYFTPGHALADYHLPQLQWIDRNVLYTLIWDTDEGTMIQMANSALEKGPW